jgi:hypothetical protein
MSNQAREALRHLTAALESHLEAVEARRSASDATVDDAFDAVAEAFERYEDELDAGFGESLPIVLDDEPSEGFDEEDDEEDDEDDEDDEQGDELLVIDEDLDGHATENEDEMDDDIEVFDLR